MLIAIYFSMQCRNTSQSGMKPMPLSEKLKLSKTLDSTKTKKTKPINMENRGENYQNRQLKRSSLNMPINHEKYVSNSFFLNCILAHII